MAEPVHGHIVLVHGAWQGRWAFAAWVPLLEAAGWRVHAVDLPGNGWGPEAHAPASLDAYVDSVARVMAGISEPVVLVGHSGGGLTVSQVAEEFPQRVRALVYIAGMMLPSGMSFASLVRQAETEAGLSPGAFGGIAPYLTWDAGHGASSVSQEGAMACFLQDCPQEKARQAASLLRPQPEGGRAMTNRLTPERFGRIPRLYVECLQDCSVLPPLQQLMLRLTPGARHLAIDSGHVPQLACPQALTDLLLPELAAPMFPVGLAHPKPVSASSSPNHTERVVP